MLASGGQGLERQIDLAVLLGLRLFKRLDSPLGVLGVGPDLGVVRVGRIDADVQAILHPFRRSAVGVA